MTPANYKISIMKFVNLLLPAVSAVSATQLLLPLYNAPGSGGTAWSSVRSSLASHPSVTATLIINVAGSFALGLLVARVWPTAPEWLRFGLGTGVLAALDENDEESPMIPAINEAACIGCGACEYVCPSRPFSAIYVEGHEVHKKL
jgi:NAD-dependent dihydropyrimidine dehydrogenase PreA subunit